MDKEILSNLIASYQSDGGFIVHDRRMLEEIYAFLGIDPRVSLDSRIFELEGISHFFQPGVIALARKIGVSRDDRVLCPGDGSGAPSRLLVKSFGCRVTGVDINPDQLVKARDCAQLHGVEDRVEYFLQDVERLSLPRKDFSRAFCNETCCHWQDKPAAFSAIAAHLKPGALIGLNLWLKGDRGSLKEACSSVPEFRLLYRQGIWFQEDLFTYGRILEEAGFAVQESREVTDLVDIRMRARIKARQQWELYARVMGEFARENGMRYYRVMVNTHYDYLRYGTIVARKKEGR